MTTLGKFITLEGIEGVGKSTVHQFLVKYLASKYHVSVSKTREPGGTPLAEKIRDIALHTQDEIIHPDTELLLMFAARAQHWQTFILPALKQGFWVVSDRFIDASYAYQGGGREIPVERIAVLEKWVLADAKPDLVILLDAPVSVGMERAKARRQSNDRFEQEHAAFFERVRDMYLQRAKAEPNRYAIVNAEYPLEEVEEQVAKAIDAFCEGLK